MVASPPQEIIAMTDPAPAPAPAPVAAVKASASGLFAKFDLPFFKKLLVELAQTAFIAGALGGLTFAANEIPIIGDHYGLSPLVTTQLVVLVGGARAFISGLNSAKTAP